jgi:hypothetical protein
MGRMRPIRLGKLSCPRGSRYRRPPSSSPRALDPGGDETLRKSGSYMASDCTVGRSTALGPAPE